MNTINITAVLDMAYGDSGKGQVTYNLLRDDPKYTHVVRVNGGANAGHTIYHNGKKIVTHIIPCGVLFGKKSIIGGGCVINIDQFFQELMELKECGIETKGLVYVSKAAHIVQCKHLNEEKGETDIGTTKRGIGPAYRDKAARIGLRAENLPELKPYLIDMYEEFYLDGTKEVLVEGAQGFYLDIDLGDYPYVTSSNCGPGAILNNGFSYSDIKEVWGVCKAYETYVGSKNFQGKEPIWETIQQVGQEFGATTGRKRQCNLLNLDNLIKAINISGVTNLNIRKLDILEQVNFFRVKFMDVEFDFDNSVSFQSFITKIIQDRTKVKAIFFSRSPLEL